MNFIAELGYVRKIRQVEDRTTELMRSGEQYARKTKNTGREFQRPVKQRVV